MKWHTSEPWKVDRSSRPVMEVISRHTKWRLTISGVAVVVGGRGGGVQVTPIVLCGWQRRWPAFAHWEVVEGARRGVYLIFTQPFCMVYFCSIWIHGLWNRSSFVFPSALLSFLSYIFTYNQLISSSFMYMYSYCRAAGHGWQHSFDYNMHGGLNLWSIDDALV